jgi:hypothetical protein
MKLIQENTMIKVTYRVQLRNEEGENYRHFNIDVKGGDSVEREKELIKNIKQMHPEAARYSFQEISREDV